jgi:hypothetical protein
MTTIILTSTVNIHPNATYVFQRDPISRIQTYISSILNWLNNTKFNIVLVENSGYNFYELYKEKINFKDRFEVIVFDEIKLDEAKFIQKSGSKGRHEVFAINYAFNNSKILQSSNFIIKITARFYIPDFENYLNNYDLNSYDCLVQNNRDRCEVVGSHQKYFSHIFDMNNINDDHIENVWRARTSTYTNIFICKPFEISETQRGGQPETYTTI